MKKIDKMLRQLANLCLFDKFLLLAPLVVWFSYQPNIYLGHSSAMNIELSLVLIYVAVLAVFALPLIFSNYQELLRRNLVRIVGLFILWSFISIIWSSNLSRAILTTGAARRCRRLLPCGERRYGECIQPFRSVQRISALLVWCDLCLLGIRLGGLSVSAFQRADPSAP